MATRDFTYMDYFSAALTRQADLAHLRTNQKSIIFSVYCAGVAIECMLRAYVTRYASEFDSRHNLEKLYEKSQLGNYLEQREALTIAVKQANSI